MTELKPCPFCGGEAELHTRKAVNGSKQYRYRCSECHASIGRWHGGVSGHPWTALEAWNNRAERTCRVINSEFYGQMWVYCHTFSCDCGQRNLFTSSSIPPNHCPNCGARVVGGDAE